MSAAGRWLQRIKDGAVAWARLPARLKQLQASQAEIIAGSTNQQHQMQHLLKIAAGLLDVEREQKRLLEQLVERPEKMAGARHAASGPASGADVLAPDLAQTAAAPAPLPQDEGRRNWPWRIMPGRLGVRHPGFEAIRMLGDGESVLEGDWSRALSDAATELESVPHAEEVLADLAAVRTSGAVNGALGGTSSNAALFLYWLVRQTRPKVVVQTGAAGGFACALITLALVMNGQEGRLHVVEVGRDDGATADRLIPEAYRDRCVVHLGETRDVLPPLVDALDEIDLFVHASDHDFEHTMFEFEAVHPKLARKWMVAAFGVAENAALWDFADECSVTGYNFAGEVGVTFR